jgi:hypothetical protein
MLKAGAGNLLKDSSSTMRAAQRKFEAAMMEAGVSKDEGVPAVKEKIRKGAYGDLGEGLSEAISAWESEATFFNSTMSLKRSLGEFAKPPNSLTEAQYRNCLASIKTIQEQIDKPTMGVRIVSSFLRPPDETTG